MTDTQIAGFEILSILGEGERSVVYHAVDSARGRPVALKVLDPRMKYDDSFVRRFRQSMRVAGDLRHPNILRIYACGGAGRTGYVAMELIEGETLRSMLGRGPLAPQCASAMMEQIGAALDYAHSRGVQHRDLKPSNILVRNDGAFVLGDFGFAWATRLAALTWSTATPSIAPYMAPEQCAGLEVDHRADLYALAVVLFEALTGRRPFDGEDPGAICHGHMQLPPPALREFSPGLGQRLQKVMERALAKDPNRRYQCGVELAAEVAKACRSLRPPVKSRSRPTRTVDATDPAGKQAAARRAGTPKVPAQKAPARPRTSLKEVSKRVAVVAVSLSRKGWGTSEAILKATGGGTARLKAGISAAGQRGAAALRARSAKEKRVGAQVAETPATSAAVAAPPVAPSVAANTEAPEATPRSTGGEKSETPPAPKPAFRVALPRVVAAAGLAMVVAGIALGARFLPRRPTAPTAAPLVSSAGQGASTAPSAVEKRRADQAKLEQRFHGYLDRFEKYHRERKRFNVDERHRRLAGFKRQLDALMAEYEVGAPVGKEHDAFRSEVCRELGTLEWYLADRYSARRQWRRALALDPGNALARAWLRETKGAVLEE